MTSKGIWAGRVASGLVTAFLLFDAAIKLLRLPFAVEATLTLTPPNGYLVQGFITGRSAEAERLVREITLGAPPDASGSSAFSFEGSY